MANNNNHNKRRFTLIIPNIRSAHNVGSLFRSADGAGVTDIILCGYSPLPLDKFGGISKPQKEIAKTALGAEQVISFSYEKNLKNTLKKLKETRKKSINNNKVETQKGDKKGESKNEAANVIGDGDNWLIVGLEQDEKSLNIFERKSKNELKKMLKNNKNIALVVGEEVWGMTKAEKSLMDILIELPMKGKKESLNVSVAGGIALYEISSML